MLVVQVLVVIVGLSRVENIFQNFDFLDGNSSLVHCRNRGKNLEKNTFYLLLVSQNV